MQLKQYQLEALAVLRGFFEEARVAGAKSAYETIVREPEQKARLGHYAGNYKPLDGLPDTPYVCLRLPTGGGKTLLAAHAVAVARDAWVEKDYPLVLWLVPSTTIRKQTVEALKNTQHPYRQVLDEAFDGRVRIFDIADFTQVRPQDIRSQCCVVVGTIQTLRVTNTEGRKVYAHHEEMEPHFSGALKTVPGLEKMDDGGVKFSFANLLHAHRPLMIVDEAHNAVTELTREMQERVNPCAIVEFTATPRDKKGRLLSNILHSVAARELKNEEMIKLPIMLSEHDVWQSAVDGAVAARATLEKKTEVDADYIRPIVLFQAQPKGQDVTVDVLKKYLVEEAHVPESKIAIATGEQRELDGIDLFDPKCPIEFVITMEALKEGWDCSFAYVFCSVARIQSASSVEQLFGRVLRMPYAQRRRDADLNKAYAFLSEATFGEAARALTDKLIAMGFEEEEAAENIEIAQESLGGRGDLFATPEKQQPVFRCVVRATPELTQAVENAKTDGVTGRKVEGGKVELVVAGEFTDSLERKISAVISDEERSDFSGAVAQYRVASKQRVAPAKPNDSIKVPRLMVEIQGELEFADAETFTEFHDWSLHDHPARLEENEFSVHKTAQHYEIDLDGRRVKYQFSGEEQLGLDVEVEGWTPEQLTLWLDRKVRQPDIRQPELIAWLGKLVSYLTGPRNIPISALMQCKFLLARRIHRQFDVFRQEEQTKAYQGFLFAPDAVVKASLEHAFAFRSEMYLGERCYGGGWKPQKHFLGPDHVPHFDGSDDGEEIQCAKIIDSLTMVRSWIRNVAKHQDSFWFAA